MRDDGSGRHHGVWTEVNVRADKYLGGDPRMGIDGDGARLQVEAFPGKVVRPRAQEGTL